MTKIAELSSEAEKFSSLRILKENIVFQFLEETTENGQFKQISKGSIIIMEGKETQMEKPRWGRVICVGDEVNGLSTGDYIYIKSLQWTPRFLYEGEKLWTTDINQIIAVSDTEPSLAT